MNKTLYEIKESAEYLGISVDDLLKMASKNQIKVVRGARGKPFKCDKDVLNDYKEKKKLPQKSVGKDDLLDTHGAAEYLGLSAGSIRVAAHRGSLMPDSTDSNNQNARLFKKSTLDAYKLRTETTKEVISMTAQMPKNSRPDGYKTAGRLLAYCKAKGYENPWEAIKDLLDAQQH